MIHGIGSAQVEKTSHPKIVLSSVDVVLHEVIVSVATKR